MQAIRYSSNNSGGSFWLSESDWNALRDAGWEVDDAGRWGEPTGAYRFGLSLDDAIDEFDRVTSQLSSDEGCSCCGQPHYFYEDDAESRSLTVSAERAASTQVRVVTKSVRSRRVTRDNLIEGGHEFEEEQKGSRTTFVVTVPAGYEFSIVVPE